MWVKICISLSRHYEVISAFQLFYELFICVFREWICFLLVEKWVAEVCIFGTLHLYSPPTFCPLPTLDIVSLVSEIWNPGCMICYSRPKSKYLWERNNVFWSQQFQYSSFLSNVVVFFTSENTESTREQAHKMRLEIELFRSEYNSCHEHESKTNTYWNIEPFWCIFHTTEWFDDSYHLWC